MLECHLESAAILKNVVYHVLRYAELVKSLTFLTFAFEIQGKSRLYIIKCIFLIPFDQKHHGNSADIW